ncbi:MAG: hypothetical protein U1A78_05955 [Polyangia bacterium]
MFDVTEWQTAGPHRYQIRGDFILWESHGPVEPPQAHTFAQLLIETSAQHGAAYCLCDGRALKPVPAESRRVYIEYLKRNRLRFALAIFGAPLPMRVAGMLVMNAARLLSLPELHVAYFATEPEAARYLEVMRQRFGRAE